MKINSLQRFHHPECPPRRNFNVNLYKDMKTNSVKGFRPTKCPPRLEIKSGISAAKKELLRMEQLFFMTIKNL